MFLTKPPEGVIKGDSIPRENEYDDAVERKRQRTKELIEKYYG